MRYPPHLLVVFTGRSGSGKTEVANECVALVKSKHRKIAAVRRSFADPLKAMLETIGVEKGEHPRFRSWAQRIGTDIIRRDEPGFWVNLMLESLEGLSAPTLVCVDDGRFGNETDVADLVVRLTTNRDTGLSAEQMLHTSERLWEVLPADLTFCTDHKDDKYHIADAVVERAVGLMGMVKTEAA